MRFCDAPRFCTTPERPEPVSCHNHGWTLMPDDPRVIRDDEGRYFCDQLCYEEWLQEQRDEGEEGKAQEKVPAA